MAVNSGSNRWWENYLVRYFLPSLAGMVFVRMLFEHFPTKLFMLGTIFLIKEPKDFGTAHLILWVFAGTLYCYCSSYPCLVFHATRVLDFKRRSALTVGVSKYLSPHVVSVIFAIGAYIVLFNLPNFNGCASYAVLIGAIIFSAYQIYRICRCLSIQDKFQFRKGYKKTSIIYAYLAKLANRRSIVLKEKDSDSWEKVTTNWSQDIMDSYKHLREHGNTAFIFLLEITLYPIVVILLESPEYMNWVIPAFVIIWVFPSVLTHWLGQHIERRFSLFNDKHKLD